MRVESRLADVEFKFGPIGREGNSLVLNSAPEQAMATKVFVSPADALSFLGRFFRSPSAWLWLLGLPMFYLRARREKPVSDSHSPW
jgi:hypothetical protein